MKRMSMPRAVLLAGFHAVLLILLFPSTSSAQRGETRNFTLQYAPGGPTRNGYADAQLEMSYWVSACPEVYLVLQRPSRVHMLVGAHRYWINGRQVTVPSNIPAPDVGTITVTGTVRGNGIAKPISTPYAVTNPNCFNNGAQIGQAAEFFRKGMTDAEKVSVLNNFGFDHQQSLGPLRSAEVENHFRELWAAQSRDSAQKAMAARSDSLRRARLAQAAKDSVARAEAAAAARSQAESQNGEPSQGASGTTAATTGSSTGSTTGTSGTRTQEQIDAARAREAQEARDKEAEHARVTEANRREKAIQDSIAIQQTAEAVAQGAMAVGQLLGMMFDGLEGTGLMVGGSYGSQYFSGDKGIWGITISGYMDGFMLPFMELNFAISPIDDGRERTRTGATIGSVIPKTGFTLPKGIPLLGGQWKAHAGLVWLVTQEQHREFNYIERNRTFLMFGATHFGGSSNTVLRLDATIYGGTPKLGVALGKAF
jgi:hypothetical protein